ncbi:MAG TPA: ubiquinol-cytochrome c reductase iron-sulfur subunit [Bacteroidales bacterium]|nr:ubiquinol-cytochrome c reductase iron-sulfur subunit [Bacteroidales bacterium]
MRKTGRRSFLELAMTGIIALVIFIWNRLVYHHIEMEKQKVRILPYNENKTVSFLGNYLVVNQEEKTTVFSAHCTHLGCIIDQTEGDRLVCPCHGSEYDLNGDVVKGPAYKSLKIIPSKITPDGTHIEINGQ